MHAPIFIVGYMGSGKSTVGRKMADVLGWRFIDTDFFIENWMIITLLIKMVK